MVDLIAQATEHVEKHGERIAKELYDLMTKYPDTSKCPKCHTSSPPIDESSIFRFCRCTECGLILDRHKYLIRYHSEEFYHIFKPRDCD